MDFTYISSFLSQVNVRIKSTRIKKNTVKLGLYQFTGLYSNRVKLKNTAVSYIGSLVRNYIQVVSERFNNSQNNENDINYKNSHCMKSSVFVLRRGSC